MPVVASLMEAAWFLGLILWTTCGVLRRRSQIRIWKVSRDRSGLLLWLSAVDSALSYWLATYLASFVLPAQFTWASCVAWILALVVLPGLFAVALAARRRVEVCGR